MTEPNHSTIREAFSLEKPVFQEKTAKLRLRLNLLALVALFIGITGKVPSKFVLLGLDLSGNESFIVWFILAILAAMFVEFACWAVPDIMAFWKGVKQIRQYVKDADAGGYTLEALMQHANPFSRESVNFKDVITGVQPIDGERLHISFEHPSVKNLFWIRIIVEVSIPFLLSLAAVFFLIRLLVARA